MNLRTVTIPAMCLADDDPDAARRHVREAMARWSHRGFLVQHWQAMRAEAEIALYVGDRPPRGNGSSATAPRSGGASC